MEKLKLEIDNTIDTVPKMYNEAKTQLQRLKFKYGSISVNHRISDVENDSWSITVEIEKNMSIYCYGETSAICIVDLILQTLKCIERPIDFVSKSKQDDSN